MRSLRCRKTKVCWSKKRWRDILLLYIVTFMLVVPILCNYLRHTPFDQLYARNQSEEKTKLLRQNEIRYNSSVEVLRQLSKGDPRLCYQFPVLCIKTLNFSKDSSYVNNNDKNSSEFYNQIVTPFSGGLAITVITVSRTSLDNTYNPRYLVQTVASFLRLFNSSGVSNAPFPIHFSVCNVDSSPNIHKDLKLLPNWLPIYHRFLNGSQNDPEANIFEKEKQDYVYCLEEIMKQNMSYMMVVEDDALPNANLFEVLQKVLLPTQQFSDQEIHERFSTEDLTYIKLYHPERLLGFLSFELERIPELLALSVIATAVVIIVDTGTFSNEDNIKCSVFQVIVLCVYFTCLQLSIGRYNIGYVKHISNSLYYLTKAPSCCTPAMLFPKRGALKVTSYLKTVTCKKGFGKDSALDALMKQETLQARLVQPNLFQHIGLLSSIRRKFIPVSFV